MQEAESVGSDNDRLAARAAGWYARLNAPDCSAEERQAFQDWCSSDEAHRRAFDAASRAADVVGSALRRDPRLRAMLAEAERVPEPVAGRGARRLRFAAAAAVVALALAFFGSRGSFAPAPAPPATARYENAQMRESTVQLADGSTLHLDAGAVVTAELGRDARRLSLLKGRAYFEVAHDASRPFSVEAAGTRTVALGTRFEVRLESTGAVVTLVEGSVAVTPVRPGDEWRRTLAPGQQLVVDQDHPQGRLAHVDASQVTAWSQGRLVFDGKPLADVLEEVNRYSAIKVVLGDERLAATPIGGTFAAGGDAGAFVQALSAILPVRSEPSGDEIVLFQRERAATPN